MKATITSCWFYIGPEKTPKGLKAPALTMRPDCPLYKKEEWTVDNEKHPDHGKPTMMIASSECDGLEAYLKEQTKLEIIEIETYYILSVHVEVRDEADIPTIRKVLETFVDRNFASYIPGRKRTPMWAFRKKPSLRA